MLKVSFIGTLGADCEKKTAAETGSKFTTFRAAHNDSWTDEAETVHTNTTWVDCILNDWPKVADYLKQGTQIYCEGSVSLRVYSSPKDRCMKAGMTIKIAKIELLGGRADDVPRELIDTQANAVHKVTKYYNVQTARNTQLADRHGNLYDIDADGWVVSGTKAESDNG